MQRYYFQGQNQQWQIMKDHGASKYNLELQKIRLISKQMQQNHINENGKQKFNILYKQIFYVFALYVLCIMMITNNILKIQVYLMSSVCIPNNKSKLSPLNLTSQAVHLILKQTPAQTPSFKKIYPTAKYATQQIRSTTEINGQITKKIKQLDRIYSEQKKNRFTNCDTRKDIIVLETYKAKRQQKRQKNNGQAAKIPQNKNAEAQNERKYKQYDKKSMEKYYDKINRIKSLKLKQYMKNKFAIETKTIQTTREESHKAEQIYQSELPHYRAVSRPQKLEQIKKNRNQTQNIQTDKIHIQTVYQVISPKAINKNSSKQASQADKKNKSLIQIKIEKSNKKTERLQKTQSIQKSFEFSRQFEQHPADIRFERINNQIDMILCSFGCAQGPKKMVPYSRNCSKYKYYVGPGNNKNLIISVMKKRWWWTQTSNLSEAQFVWTQLKQSKTFQFCEKFVTQSDPPLWIVSKQKTEPNTTALRKFKQKIKQQKQGNLFHQNLLSIEDQLHQAKNLCKLLKVIEIPKKLHNHYNGNSSLGNKKNLFFYLSSYCQYKNLNKYDYIPLTLHITGKKSEEMKKITKIFEQNPNSYWLIKPGENSNRGNGISITKSLQQVIDKTKKITNNSLILQKYIDNLFLYCNRKFDVRTYMIAITIGGCTKYYWHSEGYLRTSSYNFSLKDHSNIYVHLTNDAIQSTSEGYSKYEQGNKLSYQQFQRYLDQNYRNSNYSIKSAHQKMKNLAKLAVEAVYPKINSNNLEFSFELFGLDFIIDDKFRPWLIQINTNPCLQLGSPCLQRLIPQVVQNTFRLALDPVFPAHIQFPRSMSSFVPDSILASNRFSLIFDEFFDRDYEWQKRLCQINKIYKQEEGEQQQFQGDGEILQNF